MCELLHYLNAANVSSCINVCVSACAHLSMRRIAEVSAENHAGGEVFSEVCFVYFVECVCVCARCRRTEPPVAESVADHRG